MKRYYAGIDLGGTKIRTVITDEKKKVLSDIRKNTEPLSGVENVMKNIAKSVKEALDAAGVPHSCLIKAGIGVPGPVNHKSGVVYDCPNLKGWKNIAVKSMLENLISVPVTVENDARVAGLAEARIGAGKGYRHIFYVTVSTGIGGAIIINDKIYHGADGAAGEFGQFRLLDGTIFEKSFSGKGIEENLGVPTSSIPLLVEKNDPGAKKALNNLIYGISIHLANITTLLNPEIIIIGGGVSNLGDIFIKPVQEKVRELAFSISAKNVKVVQAGLKDMSGVVGAVELLF
jgi:glucokinase